MNLSDDSMTTIDVPVTRVRILCKPCNRQIGRITDVSADEPGGQVTTTLLWVERHDRDTHDRLRGHGHHGTPATRADYLRLDDVPAAVELWCPRHKTDVVYRSKLLAELAEARRRGEVRVIRVHRR